jgi:hypothetical protein
MVSRSIDVDLDDDPQIIVSFRLRELRYAFTRETLIFALGLRSESQRRLALGELGAIVSIILTQIEEGSLTSQRETRRRLAAALRAFDGVTDANKGMIGSHLLQIVRSEVGVTCANLALDFLAMHPPLQASEEEVERLSSLPSAGSKIHVGEIDDDLIHMVVHRLDLTEDGKEEDLVPRAG